MARSRARRGSRSRSRPANVGAWSSACSRSSTGRRSLAERVVRARARRGAPPGGGIARGLALVRAAPPCSLGRPRAHVEPLRRRPRRACACASVESDAGRLPRGRYAVVHDRVRPRHAHLVACRRCCSGPSSPPARCACSRQTQATVDDPERDAEPGQDHPRDAPRQGRARVDRPLLRHGRRDAALPHPAVRAVALDGRSRARARARGARAPRARVDRRARRPRRRRLRRVRAPRLARDPQPDVEGLGDLDGVPRRNARRRADRRRRGAGLRLRREAARSPSSRARSGATRRPPSGWNATRRCFAGASTRRSGSPTAASTRSASTARSGRSTRSASNIGHLLWSGIVPEERRRRRRRRARRRAALVGMGRSHDGGGRGRVQPARLPQRHRVATRQFPRRVGARAQRPRAPTPRASCTP